MDKLQQLTVFRRVVETGNITRAARDLGLSQPSVSRHVAELEHRLGVPLLLRSSHGLAPTEAGNSFYAETVRILDALDEAESSVRNGAQALAGTIRVACSAAFFTRVVMRWIPGFLAANPEVTLEARLDDRQIDLVEEGVDLAIRIGPIRQQSLIARRIGRVDFGLFAAPSYAERHPLPETPEQLADHEICILVTGPQPDTLLLEGPDGRSVSVPVHGRFRASSIDATQIAVQDGLGIGLLSRWRVGEQVATGSLIRVLPDWRAEPRDVNLVWPGSRVLPRRVRAFVDLLVERAAAEPRLQAR
ncbi:MAG: LysR family transcriptional regulator [Acetobacteraceae bacterium]|nr:LysR family transcriptional regulator [Acetobacteraceae bacterium]